MDTGNRLADPTTNDSTRRQPGRRDWGSARGATKDREAWRQNTTALLCAYWHDEFDDDDDDDDDECSGTSCSNSG